MAVINKSLDEVKRHLRENRKYEQYKKPLIELACGIPQRLRKRVNFVQDPHIGVNVSVFLSSCFF